MCARFPTAIERHPLRREIIATQLSNSMINRGGPTLVARMVDQTGAAPEAIAAAFAAVRDSYGMPELNGEIDALDGKVPGALQLELYTAVQNLLLDRIVWFLRNADLSKGLAGVVEHYRAGIAAVENVLDAALTPHVRAVQDRRCNELVEAKVPRELATRMARLPALTAAPDIVLVSDRTGQPVGKVTNIYFAAGDFFRLDRIVDAARAIKVADYFDRLALDRALDSIGDAERRLSAAMAAKGGDGGAAVMAWVEPRREEVERIRAAIAEIANSGLTLSKLSVAASLLGDLVRR
jgi:glutamate dehydrogenase